MATSEVDVYPSPTVGMQTPTPTGSNGSNGSFAPVLIVLAVIVVLAIISVVVGRICNKKKGGHKVKKDKKSKSKSKDKYQTHSHHHGQVQPGGDPTDIEFGFDKRFASAKVASGDHGFDFKVPPKVQAYNGGGGGRGGGNGGAGGGGGDHGFDFRGQKVQAYNGGAGGGGGGVDHGFDFRGPKVQAYNGGGGGGAGGGHGPRGPHAVRFADEHRVDFRTGA